MKHVVLLPERYQLGDVISFKVRRVPSIKADRLTVCCVPNQRFLYPTATDFVDVSDGLDGNGERALTAQLKEHYPDAEHIKISREFEEVYDFQVTAPNVPSAPSDVLIAPRKKLHSSPHRNWNGWPILADMLYTSRVHVNSIGKIDEIFDARLSHINDLEWIAAAMLKTKLVVSTDSGLAHLAILLRVPLAVIWGEPVGVIPGQTYQQGCHRRMEAQKHSPVWHIEGGWENPSKAFQEVNQILCGL